MKRPLSNTDSIRRSTIIGHRRSGRRTLRLRGRSTHGRTDSDAREQPKHGPTGDINCGGFLGWGHWEVRGIEIDSRKITPLQVATIGPMNTKCLFIVASSLVFVSPIASYSQDSDASPASATTPSVHPQIQAALVNLTIESNALHTLLHSIGNVRVNTEDRLKAMNAYMQQKNLIDGWRSYSATTTNLPAGTSFNEGYQTALAQQKLLGTPQPTTQDLDALTNDVAATTTLAQESWNSQNKRFQQVSLISSYLQSKNELVGYQQWAPNYAASQRSADKARYAAANQAQDQMSQAYYQHLDALHAEWDKQPHGTGEDFNYGFSQGNGPNEGGTGESTNTGGVGTNAPNVVGANTPWSYAGAQGGYYPGAYGGGSGYYGGVPAGNNYNVNNTGGYYNGSNYNSYSDTYPDLYGYPDGTDMGIGGFGPNGINNVWNRTNGRGNLRSPNGIGGAGVHVGGPAGAGHAGGAAGVGQVGGPGGAGQVGGPGGAGRVDGPGGARNRK